MVVRSGSSGGLAWAPLRTSLPLSRQGGAASDATTIADHSRSDATDVGGQNGPAARTSRHDLAISPRPAHELTQATSANQPIMGQAADFLRADTPIYRFDGN